MARSSAPDLIPRTPGLGAVLDAVEAVGGSPLLVGGCVRDALRGAPSKDVDVEVYGVSDVDALADHLALRGRVDAVGRSFGVLKVRTGDGADGPWEEFDVSLPRRDSKVSAGHRGFEVLVDPGISEEEAASRRDYTINSLAWDPLTEEVVDHFGGLEDLQEGVIRHTGSAFGEDPLRVLRGVQFAGRFGFRMAPETADLAQTLKSTFHELPLERVWAEWDKLLRLGTHLSGALEVLVATGWIEHHPELDALRGVEQDQQWHAEGDVFVHSGLAADRAAQLCVERAVTGEQRVVVVAAALCHDLGKVSTTVHRSDGRITSAGHALAGVAPTASFLASIGAPRALQQRVAPLVREHMVATSAPQPSAAAVRRLARRLRPATVREWDLVCTADKEGRGPSSRRSDSTAWAELAVELRVDQAPPAPLLTGDHLIGLGMAPGPDFAPVLAAALAAQDDGRFDDEAGALAWARQRLRL